MSLDNNILTQPLYRLRQWCQDAAHALEDLRHWGTLAQLADPNSAARLAHLQRRLSTDRTTVAFVGEAGRGKTKLINTLLFSDFGGPALPEVVAEGMVCPIELRYDPTKPPSIRLLPIETREDPRSLREFLAGDDGWAMQMLDLSSKNKIAQGLSVIAETKGVQLAHASKLGLPPRLFAKQVAEDGTPEICVPRWRYAQANLPHPALRSGLTLMHIPSVTALQIEPELSDYRLPEADALVFVADILKGIEPVDAQLWRDHCANIGEDERAFVMLNRLDELMATVSEDVASAEVERRGLAAASILGISRTRVFVLSSATTSAMPSELNRFATSIADAIFNNRAKAHAAALQAESGSILSEGRHLLESRKALLDENLSELNALLTKNQRLMSTLSQRVMEESARVRSAQIMFDDCSASHLTNMEGIRTRLEAKESKQRSAGAAAKISSGNHSKDVDSIIADYLTENAELLDGAVSRIVAVQNMVHGLNRAFSLDYGLKPVDVAPFPTQRFAGEMAKLESKAKQDFKGAKRSLTRSWDSIAEDFTDEVASKVDHIFAIAARESNLWLNSLMRDFETELSQMQSNFNQRLGSMTRLKEADEKLNQEVDELTDARNAIIKYREQLADKARQIARLLEQVS